MRRLLHVAIPRHILVDCVFFILIPRIIGLATVNFISFSAIIEVFYSTFEENVQFDVLGRFEMLYENEA